MAHDLTPADPMPVLELLNAFRKSKIMFAASSLGVFESLANQWKTSDEIAKELNANADALERLLGGCVMLGLLIRSHGKFSNKAQVPDDLAKRIVSAMRGDDPNAPLGDDGNGPPKKPFGGH